MASFTDAIFYLENIGFTDVILPFILVFTVMFAVLEKVSLFGDPKQSKKYNIVISLAIALTIVMLHRLGYYQSTLGYDPIDVINAILPGSALIILVILIVLIVLAVIMPKDSLTIKGSPIVSILGFLGIIALAAIIIRNIYPTFLPYSWLGFLDDSGIQSVILMLLVFLLVVWFVTSEPKKPDEPSGIKGFHEFMKELTGTNK